ncbi:Hsp20/alpha crystallin family protein [Haloplanus sp. GCM10025708]|uniref:Hsp20/alpha crystallin family protein n=1 Tax=Haloferacaceae TaxID=1644056 RepID=UPI00361F1FAF
MHRTLQDVEDLFEQMDRQFDQARVRLGGEIGTAAVDVAEWDGEFLVIADLPGFEREDIDVRLTDHTLHIDAEHVAEHEPEADRWLRRERARTSVSRRIELPEAIDEDSVSATYENGVLTVTLPKESTTESTGGRRISIQ